MMPRPTANEVVDYICITSTDITMIKTDNGSNPALVRYLQARDKISMITPYVKTKHKAIYPWTNCTAFAMGMECLTIILSQSVHSLSWDSIVDIAAITPLSADRQMVLQHVLDYWRDLKSKAIYLEFPKDAATQELDIASAGFAEKSQHYS